MPNLDRFAYGLADRQQEDPCEIAECTFDRCRNPIYLGEPNWDFDGEWFCSTSCVVKYVGAAKRIVK